MLAAVAAISAALYQADAAGGGQDDPGAQDVEFFEKFIRPVLVERCYQCHSAGADDVQGGLLLDSRAGLLEGGSSGPAIAPGDAEASLLIQAIRYGDSSRQMPPDGKLPDEVIAAFESWVSRGAADPRDEASSRVDANSAGQWAFQPVADAVPPGGAPPGGAPPEQMGNGIDAFVTARLAEQGLAMAARADRRTLLRRASFDLVGVGPTPQEIEAFLADDSPDAFAKVIDRLLASPAYGQRWGRHWLDLVRYCDELDQAWRYRDWVVDSFNRDLPYDRFIQQQIAGDLLADGASPVNVDGIVATTMLSIGQWSGLDRKKRLTDIVDDQIDTIGRTFLGLTVACARCHNHKFDPITTADYYGLAGIFFSSRIFSGPAYLSHGTHRLRIPLVPAAEVQEHQRRSAELAQAQERLGAAADRRYGAFARSLVPRTGQYLAAAWQYKHQDGASSEGGLEAFAAERGLQSFALQQWIQCLDQPAMHQRVLLHLAVDDYDGEEGVQAWMGRAERPWWAVNPTDVDVPIETFVLPPRSISVNPGTEGGAVVWTSPVAGTVRIEGKLTDGDPHDGAGVAWIVDHGRGEAVRELSSGSMPNGGSAELGSGITAERLAEVAVEPGDEISLAVWLRQGDAHYDITSVEFAIVCGQSGRRWSLVDEVSADFLSGNPHADSQGNAGVWQFYDMGGLSRRSTMPAARKLIDAWRKKSAEVSDASGAAAAAVEMQQMIEAAGPDSPMVEDLCGPRSPFWVAERDDAKYLPADAQAELAALASERDAIQQSLQPLPCAHGVTEGGVRYSDFAGVQDAPIHIRGSYEQLGPVVPRRFPKALAGEEQPPIQSGSGRLELARWIASPDNPLTARVMVNRIWQHHFGEGIVRTPSNLGAMGQRPTHPELLDFLAMRFIESGWSIKSMHRLIMLSAAWQQESRCSSETRAADPENRLLGRQNRRRLEAEAIRDSLMSVAGLLDARAGGPAQRDRNSTRRMLYLAVSRSDRSGFGALFDGANASIHVDERTGSIVAPQALYLMNDPLAVRCARALANRTDVTALEPPDERVRLLYRLVYGREASEAEVQAGRDFCTSMGPAEAATPAEAVSQGTEAVTPVETVPPAARATDGEALSPWEAYAQALILSNEFLFVD